MPLTKSILVNELKKIMDSNSPDFIGFPSDNKKAAANWSKAINTYAKSVIPASTTSTNAKAAMEAVLQGLSYTAGSIVFVNSFTSYSAILATGMSPSFTGTPPPKSIDFTTVFTLPYNTSIDTRIQQMASIIDTWFRTGLAVNATTGATINWN